MLGNFIAGKTSLFVVIGLLLFGTHYYSYQQGWAKGYIEGVSQQNHEYDKRLADCQEQQKKVFEQEKLVLTAKLADYQQKIQTAHKTEMHYLQQLKILEFHQQQLKRQLHDVTSQFIDEMGQLHALSSGFTNGFVQQVNAAFGVSTDSGTNTPSAQSTSRAVSTVKTRLRLSELTQQDLLAWLVDTGQQCQALKMQVNELLDLLEAKKLRNWK